MSFIDDIAKYVKKYAPQYGICVYSPIIAQAILESASGTSNKVKVLRPDGTIEWRHNYFGLKWRDKRCAISNDYFEEWTSEQRPDTTRYNKVDKFCRFKSMEEGVIGYFQWTNTSNYRNLKGVTDPLTYLVNIKKDKYATSIDYVENVMAVVHKYNLTKYDPKRTGDDSKMIINVHAGHNPDGKVACGAIGLLKESTENRRVKDKVIEYLRKEGHTVYDCTVDDGKSKSDVLSKIVAKCNAHQADLDVSIHFNAGASDMKGNGKTAGTEVFLYNTSSEAKSYAQRVVSRIEKLGYKLRDDAVKDDVKSNSALYVLKNTKAPAMLIECCFVDDADDVKLYNPDTMAKAIAEGILNKSIKDVVVSKPTQSTKHPNAVGANEECPFLVKTLEPLNIRKSPGGDVVEENGCKVGIYTIVKVNGYWGLLKSGKGWISIHNKYVTRV